MSKWYYTIAAVHIPDPDHEPENGVETPVIEVPSGRCIELDDDTAKALERHNAVRVATKGEVGDEAEIRETTGALTARSTLSAARGMVSRDDNRAVKPDADLSPSTTTRSTREKGTGRSTGKKADETAGNGDEML